MCQCLAVECTHPSSPASEDGSPSEATTPVPTQHLRPVRTKKRKQSPAPAPPTVRQLMEMGFPRRNIEFALKSLTGTSGNAAGLPGTRPPRGCRMAHACACRFGWRAGRRRGATVGVLCVLTRRRGGPGGVAAGPR